MARVAILTLGKLTPLGGKGDSQLLTCCSVAEHPWDRFKVDLFWRPRQLRCLIVGENPGDVDSAYFYEAPESYANDPVVVRRCLLRGLHSQKLIPTATLEGFRDAGFLFDHAIRCLLSSADVKKGRSAAMRYASSRVQRSAHLLASLSQAPVVWVMGHLANNAVVNLTEDLPKEKRKISCDPFPGEAAPGSRFFISEYFHRWNREQWPEICATFAQFARTRGVF